MSHRALSRPAAWASTPMAGGPADLQQFESERLDLGQHAVQRGLVRDGAAQQRVLALCLGVQAGERPPHGRAQTAADNGSRNSPTA